MQTLKNRLSKSRKENKGFTLVELIVVVVILAIIIGVAITGIYKYVNKARINTDINNASAIQSALSVLGTEKKVIAEHSKSFKMEWNAATPAASIVNKETTNPYSKGDTGNEVNIETMIGNILSDGLPEAKAGGKFLLEVSTGDTGSVTVSCKAYEVKADGSIDTSKPLTAAD